MQPKIEKKDLMKTETPKTPCLASIWIRAYETKEPGKNGEDFWKILFLFLIFICFECADFILYIYATFHWHFRHFDNHIMPKNIPNEKKLNSKQTIIKQKQMQNANVKAKNKTRHFGIRIRYIYSSLSNERKWMQNDRQ